MEQDGRGGPSVEVVRDLGRLVRPADAVLGERPASRIRLHTRDDWISNNNKETETDTEQVEACPAHCLPGYLRPRSVATRVKDRGTPLTATLSPTLNSVPEPTAAIVPAASFPRVRGMGSL